MTSKERMNAVMTGGKPDRVPLMCQLSLGHIYKYAGLGPEEYWLTPEGMAEGYIQLAERYHFDGILVNKWGGINPSGRSNIRKTEKTPHGYVITFKDESKMLFPPDDDPRMISERPAPQARELSGIDPEKTRMFNSEDDLPAFFGNVLDNVLKHARPDISIHGEVGVVFDRFLSYMGSYENGLIALADDPDKCKAVMEVMNQDVIIMALAQCKRGLDAFKLSSPLAGANFISRGWYEEFVLPYERDLISKIHESHGLPCYIHTCGSIGDRLDLMLASGADGLECLDPAPLGTVDLACAVEEVGDKIFIKGNLDSVNELSGHSIEEVKEIALKRIAIGKKAKGFILSSACSVSPRTPPENIRALYAAVEEGGYF